MLVARTHRIRSRTLRQVQLGVWLLLGVCAGSVYASSPGCVGKMWNPLTDLDFRDMGAIKVAAMSVMKTPTAVGEPAEHKVPTVCACKNGVNTGIGIGLGFWAPAYINDIARSGGCIGFLDGTALLSGFSAATSSGQAYSMHEKAKDGVSLMQVHWAYADLLAIAGKSLFEKCGSVKGSMEISYLTELDMTWQNDVYGAILSPQSALLAAVPLLAQFLCGEESMANSIGVWQDTGICAWNGTRYPLTGNSIDKDSAQVTNMDATIKYLTRSAELGTTLRTMGADTICGPKYSPLYHPFQHRFNWSYPGQATTRFNSDVMLWGMFTKNGQGTGSMIQLTTEASSLADVNATVAVGSQPTPHPGPGTLGNQVPTAVATSANVAAATALMAKLPKSLNYPTREAGYMQVWEARECCIMILTLQNIIQTIVENILTMGSAEFAQYYQYYQDAMMIYQAVTDPTSAILNFVGSEIAQGISAVGGGILSSMGYGTSGSSTTSTGLDFSHLDSFNGNGVINMAPVQQ